MNILPTAGYIKRNIEDMIEDLPAPVRPTIPIFYFG